MENILRENGLVNLTYVRIHAGNPANELAYHFAQISTDCGETLSVPVPYSFFKPAGVASPKLSRMRITRVEVREIYVLYSLKWGKRSFQRSQHFMRRRLRKKPNM
ncbi:hypothetical protein AVEN_111360-1 [Araneus ventricosus]|uniref:Uncharacterized protein n=1 Tax=Araneus ventricosus TaxID=182803 RepID=A0A4Y2MLX0_ARAVE|nr:hypothetical protein AVEN_111360-1 [Araneus ventricosus]